jgi:hypothetical protein
VFGPGTIAAKLTTAGRATCSIAGATSATRSCSCFPRDPALAITQEMGMPDTRGARAAYQIPQKHGIKVAVLIFANLLSPTWEFIQPRLRRSGRWGMLNSSGALHHCHLIVALLFITQGNFR